MLLIFGTYLIIFSARFCHSIIDPLVMSKRFNKPTPDRQKVKRCRRKTAKIFTNSFKDLHQLLWLVKKTFFCFLYGIKSCGVGLIKTEPLEIHLRGPFRKSHNSDRKITKIQRLGRLLLLSIQVRDFKASQVFLKKQVTLFGYTANFSETKCWNIQLLKFLLKMTFLKVAPKVA